MSRLGKLPIKVLPVEVKTDGKKINVKEAEELLVLLAKGLPVVVDGMATLVERKSNFKAYFTDSLAYA